MSCNKTKWDVPYVLLCFFKDGRGESFVRTRLTFKILLRIASIIKERQ